MVRASSRMPSTNQPYREIVGLSTLRAGGNGSVASEDEQLDLEIGADVLV